MNEPNFPIYAGHFLLNEDKKLLRPLSVRDLINTVMPDLANTKRDWGTFTFLVTETAVFLKPEEPIVTLKDVLSKVKFFFAKREKGGESGVNQIFHGGWVVAKSPTIGWVVRESLWKQLGLELNEDYFIHSAGTIGSAMNPSRLFITDGQLHLEILEGEKTLNGEKEVYCAQEPSIPFVGALSLVEVDKEQAASINTATFGKLSHEGFSFYTIKELLEMAPDKSQVLTNDYIRYPNMILELALWFLRRNLPLDPHWKVGKYSFPLGINKIDW